MSFNFNMSSYILSEFLVLDKEEQQCRQMMAGLDKVVSDLDKQEKAIYTRVRPPLEQTRPVQDSADRLQDLRVIVFTSQLLGFKFPFTWPNHSQTH